MKTIKTYLLLIFIMIVLLTDVAIAANLPELNQNKPMNLVGQVSKKKLVIGDPFDYTVTLYQLSNVKVKLDKIDKKQFKNLLLLSYKEDKKEVKSKNIKRIQQIYHLQVKDTRGVEIPKVRAVSPKIISTLPAVKLSPRTVLDEKKPMKDVHDIKNIEEFFILKIWYILTPLLIILLTALIWYLIKKFKKESPKIVAPEIIRPAHEVAYEELEKLKRMKLLTPEDFKLFYIILSTILRAYLEGRFNILALEKTSEEINDELLKISFNLRTRNIVKLLLKQSDLVKFAKLLPTKEDAHLALEETYRFVKITRETSNLPETVEEEVYV